jgi:hypothetical protein
MRELQERAKAQTALRSVNDTASPGTRQNDSTHPASGPKSRVQKKEQKARSKVQEILRESWSERAVVGSVMPISGLADNGADEESEDDVEGNEHRDEVVLHRHQRAHVDAEGKRSRATSPTHVHAQTGGHTRPLSPRNVPLPAGTAGMASPGAEDVGRAQGIEQRFAMIQRAEEM